MEKDEKETLQKTKLNNRDKKKRFVSHLKEEMWHSTRVFNVKA